MKSALFCFFCAALVSGLLKEATSQNSQLTLAAMTVTSATTVTVLPASLGFSTQAIGTTSPAKTVTLTNTGTMSLTISSIAITGINTGDFFISATTCGTSLATSASCTIKVKFKPTASGTRSAVLSISDNAVGSQQNVSLSGIGTTAELTPSHLAFGTVKIDTNSFPQTATLTNVGTWTLSIYGIAITGADPADFSQTNTCGNSLPAGASCAISVTFRPTEIGSRSAKLSVSDNAAGSPQTVSLTGTGATVLSCVPQGGQCYAGHPCCSGLSCVLLGDRAFCEKF